MKTLPKAIVILIVATAFAGCAQVVDDLRDSVGPTGPGSSYEAYLTGDRQLVVELDHAPGTKWGTGTSVDEDFERQLERITAKDVVVRTSEDLRSRGDDYAWSTSELRELHREHQDHPTDDRKVAMHALFVPGHHENENVVGLAFADEAFALFMGTIEENTCSNDALVCNRAERWEVVRAVSIHEAGHLFGLVNVPLEMQTPREDADHPGHSTKEESVMFWKVESSRALTDLFSRDTVPYRFDQHDRADAQALREGSS